MSDKIRAYLQAGEALEQKATDGPAVCYPARVTENGIDATASQGVVDFILDVRTRLPLYRKALEAVLNIKPDLLVCEKGMGEDLGEKFIRPESIVKAIDAVFSEAEAKE